MQSPKKLECFVRIAAGIRPYEIFIFRNLTKFTVFLRHCSSAITTEIIRAQNPKFYDLNQMPTPTPHDIMIRPLQQRQSTNRPQSNMAAIHTLRMHHDHKATANTTTMTRIIYSLAEFTAEPALILRPSLDSVEAR